MRDYYITMVDDYSEMESSMMIHLAKEREQESSGLISLSDVMDKMEITTSDIESVGDVIIE